MGVYAPHAELRHVRFNSLAADLVFIQGWVFSLGSPGGVSVAASELYPLLHRSTGCFLSLTRSSSCLPGRASIGGNTKLPKSIALQLSLQTLRCRGGDIMRTTRPPHLFDIKGNS